MPQQHYDFGNLCEIFYNILKDILTAIQSGETGKAIDKCSRAMRCLRNWNDMPDNEKRTMIHE